MNIGINGLGRIGRNFLRALLMDPKAKQKLTVAVINIGPADPAAMAHMFKYDTLMGTFSGDVSMKKDHLVIDDVSIPIVAKMDPAEVNWARYNIEWLVDCSGQYTKREKAQKHLDAGAPYVLVSAPCKGEDVSIVPGVNDQDFNAKKDHIVSLGSCTTNAFITMLKVLQNNCGIQAGFMTTIHAYTNTQVLLDVENSDLRRSRAAALNIIPTSTGASKMLDKVMPELKGKVKAVAIRVPVAKVSLIDLTFEAECSLTPEMLNGYFKKAAEGDLKGIVGYSDQPLVSSDYSGDSNSVVIDSELTETNGAMGKLFGWYDNEWGYSERLKDFLLYVSKK